VAPLRLCWVEATKEVLKSLWRSFFKPSGRAEEFAGRGGKASVSEAPADMKFKINSLDRS
jgi:hypothetical protein